MKRLYSLPIITIVCVCIMSAGCAKLPEAEMSAAEAACEAARAAKAPVFAKEQFAAAQELHAAALADVRAQRSTRSVFARNYDKTAKMFTDAAAAFDASKTAGAGNKAKLRQEAGELLDKIKTAIGESEKLANLLIKKKNREAALLKTKLQAVAATLPADTAAVPDESLAAVRDSIKTTAASVDSVKVSLEHLAAARNAFRRMNKAAARAEKLHAKGQGKKYRK